MQSNRLAERKSGLASLAPRISLAPYQQADVPEIDRPTEEWSRSAQTSAAPRRYRLSRLRTRLLALVENEVFFTIAVIVIGALPVVMMILILFWG
ncbi:hypothetical protein [Bradyrhizobium macuxiense]|uniref:hypothetical protein n=1 Tax=Bradyrhizobium macuxiense TaxID=1755647 RepID=UPI001365A2C1|nr:hypothetical protein [Bradyrhizobium macuxiense]